MRVARFSTLILVVAVAVVSGCSRDKQPQLMNIRTDGSGPDEFAILPNKPIEVPEDLASLPTPTPGGTNRVDPTPEIDVVVALGGNPSRILQPGIPSSDGALVAQTTRFGVASEIRGTLAAEDLEYRRKNDGRLLERVFNVNVYFRAYRPQALDQNAELLRWRRAGAKNVGAPPEVTE